MTSMIKTTLFTTAFVLIMASSQSIYAQDELKYSITLHSNGDLTVMDEKGRRLEGVTDDRPIKRIRGVKTLTVIEGEGSHFIIIGGKKYYLPH